MRISAIEMEINVIQGNSNQQIIGEVTQKLNDTTS